MRQLHEMMPKRRLCLSFLIIFLFSVSIAAAQDKVVVIPLFEDQQTNGSPAPVPRTGQTTSYATGDDGQLEKGIASPDPRFTDNGDGTVKDNQTGLIWLKNALCPNGYKPWLTALDFANSLHDGWTGDGSGGDCGLSDGSSVGDWRLPNIRELSSLIDFSNYNPTLPSGHPFTGVQPSYYVSSTTSAEAPTNAAWGVFMYRGDAYTASKDTGGYVWPVRGGN